MVEQELRLVLLLMTIMITTIEEIHRELYMGSRSYGISLLEFNLVSHE